MRSTSPSLRVFACLAIAAALTAAREARAQHEGCGCVPAIAAARETPWRATVNAAAASFTLGGAEGAFMTIAPQVERAFRGRLWVRAALPIHALTLRAEAHRIGVGDLETTVRGAIVQEPSIQLIAGLTAQWPTGNAAAGLGAGHVMLHPFVSARWSPGRFWLDVSLADMIALGEHAAGSTDHSGHSGHVGHAAHAVASTSAVPMGGYVDPHTMHELMYSARATAEIAGGVRVGAQAGASTVLEESALGQTPLWVGPSILWIPVGPVAMSAAVHLPLTEPRRFDVRATWQVMAVF